MTHQEPHITQILYMSLLYMYTYIYLVQRIAQCEYSGLQENVLVGAAPYALSTKEKLIPEYLNEQGYSSYAVGKWHLGSHKRTVTPTFRDNLLKFYG